MFVFKQIPNDLDVFQGEMVLAVVGEDERPLKAANAWLDWRLYGTISQLIVQNMFSARLGEKCLLPTYGKFKFDRIILIGGGNIFDDSVHPTTEMGAARWGEIADIIDRTIQSLKIEKIGLSLPRFDLADHERALLKTLQSSRLPGSTSLFMSRAMTTAAPLAV